MDTTGDPRPHPPTDLDRILAEAPADHQGALWHLAQTGRQLDANLIRLPPGATIAPHVEPDVDVLLVAVAGSGTLHTDAGAQALTPHTLAWLARGRRRAVSAGPEGLAYLTTHRARTGLRIQLPTDPAQLRRLEEREENSDGGDKACWLDRLCPACGALTDQNPPPALCPACGAPRTP